MSRITKLHDFPHFPQLNRTPKYVPEVLIESEVPQYIMAQHEDFVRLLRNNSDLEQIRSKIQQEVNKCTNFQMKLTIDGKTTRVPFTYENFVKNFELWLKSNIIEYFYENSVFCVCTPPGISQLLRFIDGVCSTQSAEDLVTMKTHVINNPNDITDNPVCKKIHDELATFKKTPEREEFINWGIWEFVNMIDDTGNIKKNEYCIEKLEEYGVIFVYDE
jgi:hypothetical protein